MKHTSWLYVILFVAPLFGILSGQSQEAAFVPGQLIVQLDKTASVQSLESVHAPVGVKAIKQLSRRLNIWLIEYTDNLDPYTVLDAVKSDAAVHMAQHNHYISQRVLEPNDPEFSSQWALHNTGQSGGTVDADIDAPEAWEVTTSGTTAHGDEIVVAVIDGGAELAHNDLNLWKNHNEIPDNGIDDDNNGYVDDYDGWNVYNDSGNIPADGHGTHVSGIACAIGNNSLGVSGVNWNAKVMPIAGSSSIEATVVESYSYILEMRTLYNETDGEYGAFVVSTNSSFGVDFGDPANFPIWCALYDSMGVQGILSFGATANLNIDIDIEGDVPTACPSDYMIAVTNTTRNDERNGGAAYGLTTIDLGAPGTSVLNTLPGNTYGNSTGTSMATPHCAGAIALMYGAAGSAFMNFTKSSPGQAALQMREWLLAGVDPIDDLQGITVTGGRLNLYNSVVLVNTFADSLDPNEPQNVTAYSDYTTPNSLTLSWDDPTLLAGGDTLLPEEFTIEIEQDGVWIGSAVGGTGSFEATNLSDGQFYTFGIYSSVSGTDSTSGHVYASWHAGGSPVPSIPTDLECVDAEPNVIVTWNDPLVQNDGTPIDDLDSVRVWRDGEFVGSAAAGEQSFTDMISEFGNYTYTLTAVDNEDPRNESETSAAIDCIGGDDTAAPVIEHSVIAFADVNELPIEASALVTDNKGVGEVILEYQVEDASVQSIPMIASGDEYSAEFSFTADDVQPGDIVVYSIIARDESVSENESVHGPHVFEVRQNLVVGQTVNAVIPNNNLDGISSTIDLDASPLHLIGGVDVLFKASHTNIGDLSVKLTSPNGTEIMIMDRPGHPDFPTGNAGNDPDIHFDDEAETSIEDIVTGNNDIVAGRFEPAPELLAAFNGENPAGTWTLTVIDGWPAFTGDFEEWSLIVALDPSTGISHGDSEVPNQFKLAQNYPNPFNPSTVIRYELPVASEVTLRVYDLQGRLVKTLVNGARQQAAGHEVSWGGTNDGGRRVASGVYFYQLTTDSGFESTRKMLLLK